MNQLVEIQTPPDDPVTPEEIEEYRRIRPILLQIVAEWPTLRGDRGCPAMRHILAPE